MDVSLDLGMDLRGVAAMVAAVSWSCHGRGCGCDMVGSGRRSAGGRNLTEAGPLAL